VPPANEYNIDPDLVNSLILAESGFDPKAVSRKGAQGLMQLMPQTAARWRQNAMDPGRPMWKVERALGRTAVPLSQRP